ncbi:uncharacterized protein LOC121389664 [Gigantopelta aegis]|uniref:uncharacterized protein LOC121389664 n=1 Tax=Gigantopelta aegis TaxID=1735272 RepID=UPI001B889D7A|nr:uncharacterized protein LOC121389664 [Gigantopelta aegis]
MQVPKYLVVFILANFLLWNIWIRINYKKASSTFPHEKQRSIPNDVTFQESDLLYSTPITLDIESLRKAYSDKVTDLKRNKAWKRFGQRHLCSSNVRLNHPCLDTACNLTLSPASSDANFQSVFKPLTRVKDVSGRLSEALGPYRSASEVTFVTGASSNHFKESQALMKNLHKTVFPHLKNYTFYFYDLGLTSEERQQVVKHCGCEVRSFPFHVLPERFAFLNCYIWKPLIIQAVLPHTEIVIWVDASIRFVTGNLKPLFDGVRSSGLLLYFTDFSAGQFTSKKMFDYFGDSACQFETYGQLGAGFIAAHNERFTRDVILKTWWACAVDPECMCIDYDNRELRCDVTIRKYSKCHRFEQAALTLMLAKLFREFTFSFRFPNGMYFTVKRSHTENYFEELEAKIHRDMSDRIKIKY